MQTEATVAGREVEKAEEVQPKHARDRGLLMIGLFKLSKSLFFFCLGVGAIHFLHKDLDNEATRLATALHIDIYNKFFTALLEKVDLIDSHRLRMISVGTFAYSAIALVEGVGLMLEKTWAEYLTTGLTVSFLPWEVFELVRDADWFRAGLLVLNILVLIYLVLLLRGKHRARTDS